MFSINYSDTLLLLLWWPGSVLVFLWWPATAQALTCQCGSSDLALLPLFSCWPFPVPLITQLCYLYFSDATALALTCVGPVTCYSDALVFVLNSLMPFTVLAFTCHYSSDSLDLLPLFSGVMLLFCIATYPIPIMSWLCSSYISDGLALFILYFWWPGSVHPVSLMTWLCSSCISDDLALFILCL
jgi:hypothetical protein